jgi:hypothetical protein
MAKRLFEGNDAWEDVTSRCNHEIEVLFADVLAKVEAVLGEPVDLRDFHFVGANALASFVAELSVRRRLGDGDEAPRDKSYYPKLSRHGGEIEEPRLPSVPFDEDDLVEGVQKWECGWSPEAGKGPHDNGYCLYNHTEDPMHDNCILCGQPEERK